ncbi:MAG: nuclear transport factor 2 family protein [Acidobacteria bacterium]|nr:nuclear transport factor 2 family protein [Acidobacteriota bacterium]MBI3421747.1 nuclear transport factor 2 family protein [Acidobacteriota bacterium]
MKPQHKITLLICALCLLAQPLRAQTALTSGAPISAELKPNETHRYQLTLAAQQTAHVIAAQQGADVEVLVYDAAGKLLVDMDSPNGTRGNESVWLTGQPPGVYRIEVKTFGYPDGRLLAGKYEIKLVELRAATEADAARWQAQAAFLESKTLWRPNQPTDKKAAIAKLDEAARLLESVSDADLSAVVEARTLQIAPLLKVERLGLTKTAGMVTSYHSAELAKAAASKRALLESLLNFYQPLLKTKLELGYALLNKDDGKRFCPACPFVVPMVLQEPLTFVESNDTTGIKGMLAMYKSKLPETLNNALAAEGLTYDTATPVVLEAVGYFYLAGGLRNQALGRLPKPWMNSIIETYLIHAWLGEKQPALRRQIKLGFQLPGAVITPAAHTLDTMFGNSDMLTGGVALSRAADLAADLYHRHKLGFLTELLKAFPKDAKLDAATAEQRFVALSPLIKPWMETFAYTGAALEVRQAEEALVAARKAKDGAAFDRLVADDYCGLNQNGMQRDKAGFRASATSPTPVAVFNLDRMDIEIIGDLAIVRGAQTEQWEGNALEHHLFTRLWVKRDGRWQLQSNTQFLDPNKK